MPAVRTGPVAGILLAAGTSARMGRNKLLLRFGGESVVRRAALRALGALDPVIVVLGHEAERVQAELAGLSCRTTTNPDPSADMHASVLAGLGALPPDVAAAVVLLADMPLVTTTMIGTLVERFRQGKAPLVISRYGDTHAPPHLYARSLFAELIAAGGNGKPVIGRHAAEADAVCWPADALADLDVPADREHIAARLAGGA